MPDAAIDHSLGSADVIREFERIAFERSLPKTIRFDNGAEFTSHAILRWAAERDVELHFIAPGKPTQNASIESLNGKIRDELFNMHRFTTIFEARRRAEVLNPIFRFGALPELNPARLRDTKCSAGPFPLTL